MIWIEILGPSGVGKSYWYEKFMQEHPSLEPKKLVVDNIFDSKEFENLPLKIKILFWIYRMDIYKISNHLKHRLFSYFFKGFQRKSKSIFPQEDNIIIKKYLDHIDSLKEPQIVVLKKISYFHQKLIEFKFFDFYLKDDDIYIAEDGLMHLAPIFISELQADKILIFKKDYQSLMNQRLERAANKPSTFIEYLLNENDLKDYIQRYYKAYSNKVESIYDTVALKDIRIINLDEQDVIKEILSFVKSTKSSIK